MQIPKRMTLHLGVLEQPYNFTRPLVGYKRTQAQKTRKSNVTTYQVAVWLEQRYGLFTAFYNSEQQFVLDRLESSLTGALETMIMGGPATDPFGSATQAIEQQFRDFISSKKAERVGIPGTPTLAALMGVNHRLKHPYSNKNPRRPSFRDTGLMMASFRAWTSSN